MTSIAVRKTDRIARPLKVLVPLIKDDLARGDAAGMEYYRRAGDKLREARPQVAPHKWSRFLEQNFHISKMTAWRHMRASEVAESAEANGKRISADTLLTEVTGEHAQQKDYRQRRAAAWAPFRAATARVDVDHIARERETRDEEVRLHRELALQLIDIGYKALATRLHPDRGGSKDAMSRLNRVRAELKDVAETRRFV